jgi:hypothetical protein
MFHTNGLKERIARCLFQPRLRCAADMVKPCLAYAVDAGELRSNFNRWLLCREASKTSLIITRAEADWLIDLIDRALAAALEEMPR